MYKKKKQILETYNEFLYSEIEKENKELKAEIDILVDLLKTHNIKVPIKTRKRIEKENELPFD